MAAEQSNQVQVNTCVLLAPPEVEVGKHVTDAVRAGGWTLARTGRALDAMVMLCRLELAQREEADGGTPKHMLLIHRQIDDEAISWLSSAVRRHLPGVKVHEIEAERGPRQDEGSPVVGRIGRSVSAAVLASKAMELAASVHDVVAASEAEAGAAHEDRQAHEVTRDEIAMLLSDETGLEPRPSSSASGPLPGAGAGAEGRR